MDELEVKLENLLIYSLQQKWQQRIERSISQESSNRTLRTHLAL